MTTRLLLILSIIFLQSTSDAQKSFEGLLEYEFIVRTKSGEIQGTSVFYVKDNLIREELMQIDLIREEVMKINLNREEIMKVFGLDWVRQLDLSAGVRTDALKDQMILSETDLHEFDTQSAHARLFRSRNVKIIHSCDKFEINAPDDRDIISANVIYIEENYHSRFMEYFDIVRLAMIEEDVPCLKIPRLFEFEFAENSASLSLTRIEERVLDDALFDLPSLVEFIDPDEARDMFIHESVEDSNAQD